MRQKAHMGMIMCMCVHAFALEQTEKLSLSTEMTPEKARILSALESVKEAEQKWREACPALNSNIIVNPASDKDWKPTGYIIGTADNSPFPHPLLKSGDRIVKVDNKPVGEQLKPFCDILKRKRLGEITVSRNNKLMNLIMVQ